MARLITSSVFRNSLLVILLSTLTFESIAQTTRAQRTVTGRIIYRCTFSHDNPNIKDTFQTAAEGCQHWASVHLPAGYEYKNVISTNEIGSVACLCKKGNEVNDQGGIIRGEIICPDELAVPINDGTPWPNKKCECPDKLSAPYYIAQGNKCVLDCGVQQEDAHEPIPGSKNMFKASPEERAAASKKINDYRGPKKKPGNFGYVEGEIGGKKVPGEIIGSGAPDGIPSVFDAQRVNSKAVLNGQGAWLRETDSEYKMMNRLANELGAKKGERYCEMSGTLTVVSEREYCISCRSVITQFNEMYPNVKLILVDGIK